MPEPNKTPYFKLQYYSYRLTLLLYITLLLVISISVPLRSAASLTVWAFQIVPLLVFVPGMLKKSWRTFIWLCFLLLLYFLVAVLNIFSPAVLLIDYLEITLICALFISAMLFCRWQQRYLKAVMAAEGEEQKNPTND